MIQTKITIPYWHHIKDKKLGYKRVSIFNIFSKNVSHKLSGIQGKNGNAIYRRFPKADYTRLIKEICTMIQSTDVQFNVPKKPKANEIVISYTVYKPDHLGDSFNLLDGLADSVKLVVGIDDRYFACSGIYSVIDKNNPRIELEITQEDAVKDKV